MTDAELVLLCAEKVMGAPCVGPDASMRPLPPMPFCTQDEYGLQIWSMPPPWGRRKWFDPLTNDADSCAVLDKMAAEGWWFSITHAGWSHFRAWFVVVVPEEGGISKHWDEDPNLHPRAISVEHQDRRRAIVLAALKAKGVEVAA